MPYIKTDKERGPIGAWLRNGRLGKNWTTAMAVEAMRDLGHDITADYLRQLEAGPDKYPSPDLFNTFVELYGPPPEPVDRPQRIRSYQLPDDRTWSLHSILDSAQRHTRATVPREPESVWPLVDEVLSLRREVSDLRQQLMVMAAELERMRERVSL